MFPLEKGSAMKKVYTTGDVARICRVTINTVVKWFDTGELEGYRIPSSRARRIPRRDLLAFMRKYNFPLDEIVTDKTRILLVDDDKATRSVFRKAYSDKERFELTVVASGFEGGLLAADLMPDYVFLNADLGDVNAPSACKLLRENEDTSEAVVVATSAKLKGGRLEELRKHGYDEVLRKPVKSDTLREITDRHGPRLT